MRITFGKYRGEEIDDLPLSYLWWLIRAEVGCLTLGMREEVLNVLEDAGEDVREYRRESPPRQQYSYSNGGCMVVLGQKRKALFTELIECGFKALAMKKHPDRGGTNEQMRELAELRDELRAQLKG